MLPRRFFGDFCAISSIFLDKPTFGVYYISDSHHETAPGPSAFHPECRLTDKPGGIFFFTFLRRIFCHENPFPTPAQHGTGAEYAADLPARFGFRRRYPPPYAISNADAPTLDENGTCTDGSNTYTYELNTADKTATLTKFTGTTADVPSSVTAYDGTSYTVTAIGKNAFATMNGSGKHQKNEELQSVKLPDTITDIGDHAFYYCTNDNFTSIKIPDGVTEIKKGTFGTCTSLENVTLPNGLTTIGEGAFSACSALTSIKLPDTLTKVEDAAFHGANLETIDWPESLTDVGVFAFQNATFFIKDPSGNFIKDPSGNLISSSQPIKTITYPGTKAQWKELERDKDFKTYNPQLVAKDTEDAEGVDLHCAHTVTFDKNGHGTTPEEQVVQYEGYAKEPSDPKADATTADGYKFMGWYTASEGGEKFVFENSPITKDETLFAHWEKEEKPNEPTTPSQKPNDPTPPEAPAVEEDDTAAIGYAAAAVTAAFVGWGAYRIGSEVYLKYLLPKDVLLPQNRIQLAELLWEDAGRPAPADAAAYADVDANDTDARQAARWAVENGLLTLPNAEKPEEFVPYRSVSYAKSARAWNKAQQLKENAAR